MTDERRAAPDTVTITLPREDLEDIDAALRRSIYLWNDRNEALRITSSFRTACEAALSAAHLPAPSDSLDDAISECEAKGWGYRIDVTGPFQSETRPWCGVRVPNGQSWQLIEEVAETPLAALRSAMSTALAGASGEPAQAKSRLESIGYVNSGPDYDGSDIPDHEPQ